MAIETVLGPVDASAFDFLSMHEHVFGDFRVWYTPGTDAALEHRDVRMENLGFLHWNTVGIEDNLILDDDEAAVEELALLRPTRMNALVDLTNINIGRQVAALVEVSRRARIHIAVGCGFYVHDSHPPWLEGSSEEDVYTLVRDELVDGINGSGIRPAIVGEIGTSERVTPRERKVLLACGRAAAEVGVAVNVHLDPRGRNALDVVRLLTDTGLPTGDIVLSHMQNVTDDWGYHLAVAQTGAVLEYDTFGEEGYYGHLRFASPRDLDRMDLVERLVATGHEDQLVLGNDVWLKTRLVRYGGCGYAHLATTILDRIRARGVPEAAIDKMMHQTPVRILDRSLRPPVDALTEAIGEEG